MKGAFFVLFITFVAAAFVVLFQHFFADVNFSNFFKLFRM